MRMLTIAAWHQRLIPSSLVLSPNLVLRDQVVDKNKWHACMQRYKVMIPDIKTRILPHLIPNFTRNGEVLVSTTMALVQNNTDFFCQWVESQRHHWHLPPLIIIDEAQSESVDNAWGKAVIALVQAGALALLLTATPDRSDGKPIPGFPCIEVDSREGLHTIWQQTDDPLLKDQFIYATHEVDWRLAAHHTTTFRDAWGEGALAGIERFPYDVRGSELTNAGDLPGLISDIPASRIEDYLGRIVRERLVMREGVKRFCEALAVLKQTVPECAGIIFVCNDADPQQQVNAHVKEVARLVSDYQPGWHTLIATASDGDQATQDIQRFCNEQSLFGDVLIVKQMAGRGVDPPRCKVMLDLSPVRKPNGWIQRIMRISRLYKGLKGIFICIDDAMSRELFRRVVSLNNPETQTYRTIEELLEHLQVPIVPKVDERWRNALLEEPTAAGFSDSNEAYASAEDPAGHAPYGQYLSGLAQS